MPTQRLTKSLLTALLLCSGAVHALDIRSAVRHGVVLYQAPQDSAQKLFVISRNTPVEVLSEADAWVRVRDRDGTLAWVHKADLSTKHIVVAIKALDVRQQADQSSPVVLHADKDVLFELVDNNRAGWLKVKHRDGATGYVRIEEVWGA
ncbi:SH3 domain-containing protein [Amantichitinum ursilacus]|uniref:Bacterial SH3 domain protein n=1 Tax=Amantichitinum ursilacus TaxID=857265 RepID=A0A0N0GQ18_9NEIS|nr:SH3 domain-containing protein [Amantichitinum ursilacus]KPC54324.1 Bacterial SH3 domain protein [Amantichitinum ursilacus]